MSCLTYRARYNSGQRAKESALACFFQQLINDGVNILPAPRSAPAIHLSHSIFAVAARTNAKA